MTIKLNDPTLTLDRAQTILERTSAAAALEASWFDVLENNPNLRYSEVRDIVDRVLMPVSEDLFNPILTENQFIAAPRSLDYSYDLIHRNGSAGQRVKTDRSNADRVFRQRRNFGAQSIDEFLTAVVVVADHKRETFDPTTLSPTGQIHHALNQAAEREETPMEREETPADPVEDLFNGGTEASKQEIVALLKAEIKAELKDELKAEIKAELKAELEAEKAPVREEASKKLDQLLAQYRRPVG